MNTHLSASFVPSRTIVLVGMMGAGKTSVGKRLAAALNMPFIDADSEIEAAAGMSISRLIGDYGEPEFRRLERRVMARLLDGEKQVLSTGGGAFMDDETRELIRSKGTSVYLTADIAILVERATRHGNRPLLQGGDAREIMDRLLAERAPIYAQSDITIASDGRPVDETVDRVLKALEEYAHV